MRLRAPGVKSALTWGKGALKWGKGGLKIINVARSPDPSPGTNEHPISRIKTLSVRIESPSP